MYRGEENGMVLGCGSAGRGARVLEHAHLEIFRVPAVDPIALTPQDIAANFSTCLVQLVHTHFL